MPPTDIELPMMNTDEADLAIAEAIGSRFHVGQFGEQMLVQMLLPLSVIYLVFARSLAAAANVMSIPRPFTVIAALIFGVAQFFLTTPLVVLVAWSLPDVFDYATPSTIAVLRIDVIVVAAGFVMHRLAISIKYGFQSQTVYTKRMSVWASMQDRLDDQLFASWFILSRPTITREMLTALSSIDEDEGAAAYSLPAAEFVRLRASCHADAHPELDTCAVFRGCHTVPASVLASALLLHVNSNTMGLVVALQRATMLAGIIATFGTTVLRVALSLPILGSNYTEAVIIVSHWIADFLLLPVVFTFLAVGYVDHARRTRVLEALARLFRASPMREGGGTAGLLATAVKPPIVPLASIADVRAFLTTRRLLLSFGSGFHMRLVTVLSADLCVLAAVSALCVILALTSPLADGVTAIISPVVLFFILVAPAVALCALGLRAAVTANLAAAQLVTVVVTERLRLRVASLDTGSSPPMLGLLDDMERALRENNTPITLFGIAATPALTSSLVGAFASVATVLVSGTITRWSASAESSSSAALIPSSPSPTASPTVGASPSLAASPSVGASPTASATATAVNFATSRLALEPGLIAAAILGAIAGAGILVGGYKCIAARRSSGTTQRAARLTHQKAKGREVGVTGQPPLASADVALSGGALEKLKHVGAMRGGVRGGGGRMRRRTP